MCCLFIILLTSTAHGQLIAPEFQTSMTSPDNSALIKNIENNMNYYDGTLQIQIPLYTLKEFDLEVPISLMYKTGGIKIEDVATSVGLGWNLSAGGKITRIIKRNPDEASDGYFKETTLNPQELYNLYFGKDQKDIDSEPDIFYFEFPNYSGLLVCDQSGKAHTIPYQNIDIRWVNKSYFEIKTPDGKKYTFGRDITSREVSSFGNRYKSRSNCTTSWLLNTIEDQFGHRISFGYEAGESTVEVWNYRREYSFSVALSNETTKDPDKEDYVQNDNNNWLRTQPLYLTYIAGNNTYIYFDHSPRQDLDNAFKYDRFEIQTAGQNINDSSSRRFVNFNYSQFPNNALKLDAVFEQCGTSQEKIFEFTYITNSNLPNRDSKDFDHWGYYNGKGNIELFPHFVTTVDDREFSGANHEPNLYYAQANSLRRISNKTGGHIEYRYELNQIQEDGITKNIGGLRIREIAQIVNGKEYVTSYHYIKNISGGESTGLREGLQPKYYYRAYVPSGGNGMYEWYKVLSHRDDDIFNIRGNAVGYSRVYEKFPNGSYTMYEYTTQKDEKYRDEQGVEYNYSGNEGTFPLREKLKSVLSSRFWRRGLLLKRTHYDANGNLIQSDSNTYSFGNPKSIVKGFVPYAEFSIPTLHEYSWYSEPIYLDKTVIQEGCYNLPSTVSYTYDTTHMVPKEINQIDGEGNIIIKTFTYSFNYKNNNNHSDPNNYALRILNDRNIVLPVETTTMKNGKIIAGEHTRYRTQMVQPYPNITAQLAVVPSSKWKLAINNPISYNDFTPSYVVSGMPIIFDSKYEMEIQFEHYDANGQLICWRETNGNLQSIIYDNDGSRPIAQIVNARVTTPINGSYQRDNQVFYTSFEDNDDTSFAATPKTGNKTFCGSYNIDLKNFAPGVYSLTYWLSRDFGDTWERVQKTINVTSSTATYTIGVGLDCLDEVRICPLNARMTTYTYHPNGNKLSETDENGISTYYKYDDFSRLIRVSDEHHAPKKAMNIILSNNK